MELSAFLSVLAAIAAHQRCATAIVLGLRADFYAQAGRHPELLPALQNGQLIVGSMTKSELRDAIVEPAAKAGWELEDGLAELILRDLEPPPAEAGAFPGH